MKTSYNGQTVDLITSAGIDERLDDIAFLFGNLDRWENFKAKPEGRAIIELIHDCQVYVEHYEDAARQRAIDAAVPKHQQQFANAMQKMLCPGSVPETMPERARKAGL